MRNAAPDPLVRAKGPQYALLSQPDSLLKRFWRHVKAAAELTPRMKVRRALERIDSRMELWRAVEAEEGNTQLVRNAARGRLAELADLRKYLA